VEDLCDPLSQLTRPVSSPTRYDLQVRSNFLTTRAMEALPLVAEHDRTVTLSRI
jgi:hypothetical protein